MRGLMLRNTPHKRELLHSRRRVGGVLVDLLLVREGVKVSVYTFHTLFESYENSLGTMVISRTPGASSAKETSLLPCIPLLKGGDGQCLTGHPMVTMHKLLQTILASHFQITLLSTHR